MFSIFYKKTRGKKSWNGKVWKLFLIRVKFMCFTFYLFPPFIYTGLGGGGKGNAANYALLHGSLETNIAHYWKENGKKDHDAFLETCLDWCIQTSLTFSSPPNINSIYWPNWQIWFVEFQWKSCPAFKFSQLNLI